MRRVIRTSIRILLAVCLALALILTPARSSDSRYGNFVIRNVRIFDGERVVAADSIAIVDGKIATVGHDVATPVGADTIDGTGDTLLPGLIDAHVHLWLHDLLRMGLVGGVTTQLDMYMRWEQAQQWKNEESNGAYDSADFRTAGTCFAVAGGHGTEANLPPITPISRPVRRRRSLMSASRTAPITSRLCMTTVRASLRCPNRRLKRS
jgi:hypothetical protein